MKLWCSDNCSLNSESEAKDDDCVDESVQLTPPPASPVPTRQVRQPVDGQESKGEEQGKINHTI